MSDAVFQLLLTVAERYGPVGVVALVVAFLWVKRPAEPATKSNDHVTRVTHCHSHDEIGKLRGEVNVVIRRLDDIHAILMRD